MLPSSCEERYLASRGCHVGDCTPARGRHFCLQGRLFPQRWGYFSRANRLRWANPASPDRGKTFPSAPNTTRDGGDSQCALNRPLSFKKYIKLFCLFQGYLPLRQLYIALGPGDNEFVMPFTKAIPVSARGQWTVHSDTDTILYARTVDHCAFRTWAVNAMLVYMLSWSPAKGQLNFSSPFKAWNGSLLQKLTSIWSTVAARPTHPPSQTNEA